VQGEKASILEKPSATPKRGVGGDARRENRKCRIQQRGDEAVVTPSRKKKKKRVDEQSKKKPKPHKMEKNEGEGAYPELRQRIAEALRKKKILLGPPPQDTT